jgi:hypothetical protein
MMDELREIAVGEKHYRIEPNRVRFLYDGNTSADLAGHWIEAGPAEADIVREVARLQEENAALRACTDLREAFRTLFHECRWAWWYHDDALILHYPSGFMLPSPTDGCEIANDDMAAAFAEALTKAPA